MRVVLALVLGLVLGVAVAATSACGARPTPCSANGDCEACTSGGCAWCFETNQCAAGDASCPGDRALTTDECDMPAESPDGG